MNTASNTYTSYNWIPFETEWDLGTIPSELGSILEWQKRFNQFANIDFLKLSGQFLTIEFADIQAANRYQATLQKHFISKDNSWNSEPNADETQNLKYSGRCEYNGKYYVLAQTCNKLDENNMDEEKWIWKWVIINPELYFSNEAQNQVGDWVTGILDWK